MMKYNINLQTGDIALYRRRGLLGWLITWWTGGDKSHAGIVIVDGDRHYILDARAPAVDMRPISVDVRNGSHITIKRSLPGIRWDADALMLFAYHMEGATRYATLKMLSNMWTEVFGCPQGLLDPADVPARFHCSELASRICRMFARWSDTGEDFDPCPQRPDRYTTPDDLDRKSSLVTLTDRLAIVEAAE